MMMKCFFVLALLSTAACSGASPDDARSQSNAVDGKADGNAGGKADDNTKPTTQDAPDGNLPSKDPSAGDSGKDPLPPGTTVAASDSCQSTLDATLDVLNTAVKLGDTDLIVQAKTKYAAVLATCPVTVTKVDDGCGNALSELQAMMDKAAASGDIELMAGLKNKYVLTEQSCNPPSTQSANCDEELAILEENINKAVATSDTAAVVGFKQKYVDTLASCGATTVSSDDSGDKKPVDGTTAPAPEQPTTTKDPVPLPANK